MKKKLSKILGVGLTIALLTSLLGMAAPAAAYSVYWGTESGLPDADDFMLAPAGLSVTDLAVNGDTFYAVTGDNTTPLLKSTDGGNTWTELDTTTSWPTAHAAKQVAVAADDADVVVVAFEDTEHVEYSTNGGSSWSNLDAPNGTTFVINDIDISAGSSRYVVCGGYEGTVAKMYKMYLSMAQSWTEEVQTYGTSGFPGGTAILAVKFSPNYSTDKIITAVSTNATDTVFNIFWDESDLWNAQVTGFTNGYPVDCTGTDTIATATSASIAMPPSYVGSEEAERVAYVGVGKGTTGGVWRLTDYSVRYFETWSGGDEGAIHSVAYHDSGKLLAGDLDTNQVFTCLNPTASYPKFERITNYKQPGGASNTLVAWSGDTAYAATSGDESALAMSTNDGSSWNDISLINTSFTATGTTIDDVAVSADGSKVYFTSSNTTNNMASVWLKASSWKRVLSLSVTSGNKLMARVAPDDGSVIYVYETGTVNVYVSKNAGMESWKKVNAYKLTASTGIEDLAVESSDVAYAISTSQSSKTSNAGSSWGTAKSLGLSNAFSLTVAPNGDVLVGGSGAFTFSKDGGSTYTKCLDSIGSGNVVIVADTNYADNNRIYAGSKAVIYRTKAERDPTTSSSYDPEGTLAVPSTHIVYGMAAVDGIVYALTGNSSATRIYRAFNFNAATTSANAEWSYTQTTSYPMQTTPQGLKMSSGPKFWSVDTGATPAITSFTDPTAIAGPTLTGPEDKAIVSVNPATGRAYDITFTFDRYSSTKITAVRLQIATDADFKGIIYNHEFTGIDSNNIAKVIGPFGQANQVAEFMPGATYYWRTRMSNTTYGPLLSPWSEVRGFTVEPETTFGISQPAAGAIDVALIPTLVWTEFPGSVDYEVQVSDEPTFLVPLISASTANTFYQVTEALAYSTTYYWRTRGVTGEWVPKQQREGGPWSTGVFTTMAEPVPTEPIVITQPGAPAPPPQIIEVPVVQQPAIPSYLLWVVIAIGAILIIALIVLIVRTRRVA